MDCDGVLVSRMRLLPPLRARQGVHTGYKEDHATMWDFDMELALVIAVGGLGVVFIILIALSFAIGGIRILSERIEGRNDEAGKKDG